jgi:hypothetical protein
MSRPRLYKRYFFKRMTPVEHALITYYSARYGLSISEILERMLMKVVSVDKMFDKTRFAAFAQEKIKEIEAEDAEAASVACMQVEEFVAGGKP